MAFLIIPMKDAFELGNFTFTTSLDGINYKFFMSYNAREGFWYMDVEDTENNLVAEGVKVVSNLPLLRLRKGTPRPVGELIAVDTRFANADPNLNELGAEIELGYLEESGV